MLFAVGDEPNYDQGARVVADVINGQYAEARKRGVRTATAGGYPGAFTRPRNEKGDTLGELYDVWIEGHYGDRWPQMHEAAKKNDAELWMYNCWVTGAGYLQERFHAGLWTWRTGAKGNGVWSYGWYVRLDKAGLPESKLAWEGRAAGVNDYRYLQTLEHTIAAGEASGKAGRGRTGRPGISRRTAHKNPFDNISATAQCPLAAPVGRAGCLEPGSRDPAGRLRRHSGRLRQAHCRHPRRVWLVGAVIPQPDWTCDSRFDSLAGRESKNTSGVRY